MYKSAIKMQIRILVEEAVQAGLGEGSLAVAAEDTLKEGSTNISDNYYIVEQ